LVFSPSLATKPQRPPPIGGLVNEAGVPEAGSLRDAGFPDGSDAATDSDASDATPDVFVPPIANCSPAAVWLTPANEPFSTAEGDFAPAIAGNGLSLVWLTGTGEPTVHVVDRSVDSDPWSAGRTFSGADLAPGERVAVTQDGLKVYGVGLDGRSIVQFARASRADNFGAGATMGGELDTVRGIVAAFAVGEKVSDLVVSTSGLLLVFRKTSGADVGLFISRRANVADSWPAPTRFAVQAELLPAATNARRPTGLSADGRALFYWDESTSTQRIAHFAFNAPTAMTFADLGARRGANPNAACTRIYSNNDMDIQSSGRQP
jgi:hypothetical protein